MSFQQLSRFAMILRLCASIINGKRQILTTRAAAFQKKEHGPTERNKKKPLENPAAFHLRFSAVNGEEL